MLPPTAEEPSTPAPPPPAASAPMQPKTPAALLGSIAGFDKERRLKKVRAGRVCGAAAGPGA